MPGQDQDQDQQYVVDFSDVEERDFTPLARGRYPVQVTEAEIRPGTEYPYLMVVFTTIEEEHGDRKLWDNMSFSPKALWKLKGFYRALGATQEQLATGSFDVNPDELIGEEIIVQVAVEPDQNGEPRNTVKRHMAIQTNEVEQEANY